MSAAFGYLSVSRATPLDAEQRVRASMVELARVEALDLQHVFVDRREDDVAYGFDALRVVLAGRPDVGTVVLPELAHVAHIPLVAGMSGGDLGRFLGCRVRLVCPEPSPHPRRAHASARPLAIGLVHLPSAAPIAQARWARALVTRRAHDLGLQLLDVLELHGTDRMQATLSRLAELAATQAVDVLLTVGVDGDLARRLAGDLGLEHRTVPPA